MAAPSFSRFLPLGGSRLLFQRFPSPMGSSFCALFDSLPDHTLSECCCPCDNLSCLCITALWPRLSQSVLVLTTKVLYDLADPLDLRGKPFEAFSNGHPSFTKSYERPEYS